MSKFEKWYEKHELKPITVWSDSLQSQEAAFNAGIDCGREEVRDERELASPSTGSVDFIVGFLGVVALHKSGKGFEKFSSLDNLVKKVGREGVEDFCREYDIYDYGPESKPITSVAWEVVKKE